ncbi:MAG: phosphoadenosine phosphosulfate reductase family protein [Candidatus Bipolaricaulia bacterium]
MNDVSSWTLAEREQKSLEILRQALAGFGSAMAVAFTGGKDSLVVLDLVRRAGGGRISIPVLHIDTTVDFPEVYEYRDRLAREWGFQLVIYQNREALAEAPSTDDPKFCLFCTTRLKTEALNQAIQKYRWRALVTGVRWDEHNARSQELYFSPRPDHVRVHPILHFRERDVWEYIKKYQLPYCSLYDKGYRSLGCVPCTKPVSDLSVPERAGRGTDKEGLMERLRALGYF